MADKKLPSQWLKILTPARTLMLYYFFALVISTCILSLPVAYKEGESAPFIDVLFTAVSALSVTGLTTFSIPDTFSFTGLIFLTIILHLGLLGIMSISTVIMLLLGRRIGIRERRLIMQDQNMYKFGGMVQLIKQILFIVLTVEIASIIVLGCYLLPKFDEPKKAFFHAYFYTISALSNGGFTLDNRSFIPYANDYFIQFIIMVLIIIGAIGFPVLIELKSYLLLPKHKKTLFRFSLYTKVTTTTFFLLLFVGALFIYLIDQNHFFSDKHVVESVFYALFQSVTSRSAGLSTLDVTTLRETNQLFLSILMFIGASPSSAGGGIRTTTLALVVIFIMTYARGGKSVKVFRREIYEDDLSKAVTVTLLAIFMCTVGIMVMTTIEPFPLTEIVFEVTSAFGTVGLSQGITGELSTFSKVILMIFMFIGRIGLVTFIFTFRSDAGEPLVRYPKERIMIG